MTNLQYSGVSWSQIYTPQGNRGAAKGSYNGQRLFLAQLDRPELEVTPHWKLVRKMSSAYFWVDDVEALHEEVQARGATIDWALYVTPYGVKEFGIQDLDGHDIAFGQVLDPGD